MRRALIALALAGLGLLRTDNCDCFFLCCAANSKCYRPLTCFQVCRREAYKLVETPAGSSRTTRRCHSRRLTDWCVATKKHTHRHTRAHTQVHSPGALRASKASPSSPPRPLGAPSTMSNLRLLVELPGRKYLPGGFDRILDLATAHRAKISVSIGRVGSCRAGLLPLRWRSLFSLVCRLSKQQVFFFAGERRFIGLINLPC